MKKKLFENVGGNKFKLNEMGDTDNSFAPKQEWDALKSKVEDTDSLDSIDAAAKVLSKDLKSFMIKHNILDRDSVHDFAHELFYATAFDPEDWNNILMGLIDDIEPQGAVDHNERDYGQDDWN